MSNRLQDGIVIFAGAWMPDGKPKAFRFLVRKVSPIDKPQCCDPPLYPRKGYDFESSTSGAPLTDDELRDWKEKFKSEA